MEEMKSVSQGSTDNQEVQRELNRLHNNLQRSGAVDKMEQAERAMQQGRLAQAERLQRSAQNALEQSFKQLKQLSHGLQGSKEEKLQTALEQAQDLRSELESQLQQAQEAQGQQGERTEQSREQQGSRIGNPQSGNREITQEMIDRWKDEIWRTKGRLEDLQRQIRADSLGYDEQGNRNELDRLTNEAIDDLTGFVRTFVGGDPQRMKEIAEKLIDPLRRIEAELQARIQLGKSDESLRTVRDQPIPPEYKELVEEYYRSLSKSRQ